MADIPESSSNSLKLTVFHNLPSGGGINVAGMMIKCLSNRFSINVHFLEGSSSLHIPASIQTREWLFPSARQISGIRRFAAPFLLPARLKSLDRLCRKVAEEINRSSDIVLVHNSMYVAAPPLLNYLKVPSLYFCYEFPRHLYEPALVKRTSSRMHHFLLGHLRRLERKMDMDAALSADAVVTLSGWMKKRLDDIYGIDSSIVRPGIDTEFFQSDETVDKKQLVLSIGALWPFKGHNMAIKTISKIKPEIRPSLIIIADREFPGYGAELEKLASELGVDLTLRRNISIEELRLLYNTGKAVLCCQHNEPYGLVPLEAMSCGIPVVAVKEGGFVDNIRSGITGILVNRDADEMAAALNEILTDCHLRNNLIAGGREFVAREKSAAEAADRLGDILAGMSC
jgi:glycosyltransferase involved in cell wall biosynthesis